MEELDRCTAEVSVVNPFNCTIKVANEIRLSSIQIYGVVAAVVALFPKVFPTGLPAKYFMHARMAVLSRAWGSDGQSVLCPIADLFNHQEPTHVGISIRRAVRADRKEKDLDVVEVVLERAAAKGEEVFNGMCTLTLCVAAVFAEFSNNVASQPTRGRRAFRTSCLILASRNIFITISGIL